VGRPALVLGHGWQQQLQDTHRHPPPPHQARDARNGRRL
jgi:hypothetical protein